MEKIIIFYMSLTILFYNYIYNTNNRILKKEQDF